MNKEWDNEIAFSPEVWREALRVAKPGATLMAFGGTRTHHRLTCAIEDAGWEIRDCINYLNDGTQAEMAFMASLDEEQLAAYLELHYPNHQMAWVYGSGIGLGYDVSKGIDKRADKEREVVGEWSMPGRGKRSVEQKYGLINDNGKITAPATPLAAKFDGYKSRLKGAYEIIIIAQKPMGQSYAENAERWGIAGLNIDGSRIPIQDDVTLLRNSPVPSTLDASFSCIHSFLRDFYDRTLSSVRCYSKDGTILEHDAAYRGDKSPGVFLCEPCLNRHFPSEEMCEQNLSSTQDFQSDCLVCPHLCDELSRLLLKDASGVQTLRNDVLKCIHPSLNWDDLGEVSRDSLYWLSIDHLSNCYYASSFLARLHSLLLSLSNYTTPYTIPQEKEYIPNYKNNIYGNGKGEGVWNRSPQGRYPANIVHSAEPGVMAEFAKAGVRTSGAKKPFEVKGETNGVLNNGKGFVINKYRIHSKNTVLNASSGSAARYFAQCPPDEWPRFIYQAKAGKKERGKGNNHPCVKSLELVKYLVRLCRPPDGGIVLDPFAGSGTTALACRAENRRCILIEKEEPYCHIVVNRLKGQTDVTPPQTEVRETGPQVKQLSIMDDING